MPSDDPRALQVLTALAPRVAPYREAALLAAEEVDAVLRTVRAATPSDRLPAFAAELGPMGSAHLDLTRLAPLFAGADPGLDRASLDAVERAGAVLRSVAGGADPLVLDLPPGADLVRAVRSGLARIGRAFGAAHVVAVARNGRYDAAQHDSWLERYPFGRWNRRERQLAPPVVVTLDGADLRASGLAELLDGGVCLVLLVRDGQVAPAPLVRLISPGVYVAQIREAGVVETLAARTGPAVVAWVPAGAAGFVHDPAAGPALGQRLVVQGEAVPPRRGLGGLSASQLADELNQLEALAGLARAPAGAVANGDSTHPVDRLAAWILTQADLKVAEPA